MSSILYLFVFGTVVGIGRKTTVVGVKWNATTTKRIEDDTTVVSIKWKIKFFESSTYNTSSRVQVNGEGSGVLQTVENCHIAF